MRWDGASGLLAQNSLVSLSDLGEFTCPHTTTPANPAAGNTSFYFKSDNKLYTLTPAGLETEVGAGGGDVVGPASATDNAIARFDTTTGKLIQDSLVPLTNTGEFLGVNGTTSNPSYSFSSDPNLGVYRFAADTLGFSLGGTAVQFASPPSQGLWLGTTVPGTITSGTNNSVVGSGNTAPNLTSAAQVTVFGTLNNVSATTSGAITIFGAQNTTTAGTTASGNTIFGAQNSTAHRRMIMVGFGMTSTANDQMLFGDTGSVQSKDVYLGSGVTHTSISDTLGHVTIQPTGGSGTDKSAPDLILAGSKGTGNGVPGMVQLQTSTTGTSGTTLQTLATRLTVSETSATSTVPFLGVDGTASNPSYSFSSDPNLGVYRVSSDELGFSLGGVARQMSSPTTDSLVFGVAKPASITGIQNIIFGTGTSGSAITDGIGNLLVGRNVAPVATSLDGNTILGDNAGPSLTSGQSNSLVGVQAGRTGLTSGSRNTIVGSSSGSTSNISDTIIIGYSVLATASAQGVFGSTQNPITDWYFSQGVTNSAPASFITFQPTGASGTNIAGSAYRIAGGKSTGDAIPGSVIIQTSTTGTSGTTLQTLATRMTIAEILVSVTTDFAVSTAGKGLQIKEGANAKMGTSTLVAGTVTVATTAVTAMSRVFLTGQDSSGTHGELTVSARTAGASFDITSTSVLDTRSIAWMIVEPA
jgi:hypothetical protein